ncbi:MAG: hypothetical protein GF368_02195 [Candidatus Aenigmarchaeota archaeon]|nr:hypothetical protein [Candidatus Aenigmarchaeota archaeon]
MFSREEIEAEGEITPEIAALLEAGDRVYYTPDIPFGRYLTNSHGIEAGWYYLRGIHNSGKHVILYLKDKRFPRTGVGCGWFTHYELV